MEDDIIIVVKKKDVAALIVLMFLACAVSIPFVFASVGHCYVDGDDILTHMQRVEGIVSALKAGHLPAYLHLSTLDGYAYGMGFFYPQLTLILPVLLRLAGMNEPLTTNICLFGLVFLTAFSFSFCVRRLSGSLSAGLTAGILCLFSYYRLVNQYYRGAAAESIALAFMPLLILGVCEITRDRRSGVKWMTIGLCGILYSHLLSAVFALAGLVLFGIGAAVCCLIQKRKPRKSVCRSFADALVLSFLLTAAFWLPFLEQYFAVPLRVKTDAAFPMRNALSLQNTLRIVINWFRQLPEGRYDPVLLAIPLTIAALIFGKKNRGMAAVLALGGIGAMLLSSQLFPWGNLPALHKLLQFPWRLQFIAAAMLPLAGGLAVGDLNRRGLRVGIVILCAGISMWAAMPLIQHVTENYIQPFPGYKAIRDNVGAGEYLPDGAEVAEITEHGKMPWTEDGVTVIAYSENGLSAELRYSADTDSAAELPFLWYRGWIVNGEPASMGPHGLVQVDLPAAEDGTVTLKYQTTALQFLSRLLTLVGIFGCVCLKRARAEA